MEIKEFVEKFKEWQGLRDSVETIECFNVKDLARYNQLSIELKLSESNEYPRQMTTEWFWDCECEGIDYIHPITQEKCSKCNTFKEDQPDSIAEEILRIQQDLETAHEEVKKY